MNLISISELEEILQKFIRDNGYVSERPVDLTLAAEKVKKDLEVEEVEEGDELSDFGSTTVFSRTGTEEQELAGARLAAEGAVGVMREWCPNDRLVLTVVCETLEKFCGDDVPGRYVGKMKRSPKKEAIIPNKVSVTKWASIPWPAEAE